MPDIEIPEDDQEPFLVKAETVWLAVIVIVIALGLSITTNTYHDLHGKSVIPWGVPLAFGIAVPFLVAFVSHTAATLNVHWSVRGLVAAPAAAFMAVSANAGIATLAPQMQFAWAVVVAVTVDTTAMIFLGILMYAAEMRKRHGAWERRAERRRRQAEAEAEHRRQRAEIDALAARQSRGGSRSSVPGNGRDSDGDNALGSAGDSSAGSARALPAAGVDRLALPPAVTPVAPGEAGAAGPDGEDPTSVTPFRRPAASDDEMRMLAEDLAATLEADGKKLSIRAYMKEYGGSPNRVTKIVNEVNAPERAAQRAAAREAQQPAAAGE